MIILSVICASHICKWWAVAVINLACVCWRDSKMTTETLRGSKNTTGREFTQPFDGCCGERKCIIIFSGIRVLTCANGFYMYMFLKDMHLCYIMEV